MVFGIDLTLLNICYIAIALLAIKIIALIIGFIILQLFIYFTTGVCNSKRNMNGKTVIVTGCTSGIGRETARDLAKREARVILACRNVVEATKFRDKLVNETGNKNLIVKSLDLSSFKSIREFADEINREEKRLDVLIHNAGTAETFKKKISEDGVEMTMATNQYGPFLLTHLLIDLLKSSAPSRIVIVSSALYYFGGLNFDNLNPIKTFPAYLYYVSKYANIVFSLELARRLEGTGVTANCLHPGLINSGIWRNVPAPLSWGLYLIARLFFKTPKQGAQTTIHVAVSEDLENVNGKYFLDCRRWGLSNGVSDPAKGKKFWEYCETITKLQSTDPKI